MSRRVFVTGVGMIPFATPNRTETPFAWLEGIGVDLRTILHGEQSFEYHSRAYVGETLTATPKIVDYYEKKGGALEFLVKETAVTRTDGSPVADLKTVIVVRN